MLFLKDGCLIQVHLNFKKVTDLKIVKAQFSSKILLNILATIVTFLKVVVVFQNKLVFTFKKIIQKNFHLFFQTERKRSNVLKSARIQAFCRKHNIKIGCFNGKEVWLRNITQRDTALKILNNHFCLIWKSNGISFTSAIKEWKENLKSVVGVISDKHVESFVKYEYKHKIAQSQLTNMIVYDIETFNTIKFAPYSNCKVRLSIFFGKNHQDISEKNLRNVKKDCIVFKGLEKINELLDYVLQFKGEAKGVNKEIVKYDLYWTVHIGSGFDSYVVLNNLPQWRTVVSLIKNGAGIVF